METRWNVRAARPADAARIAEIYNQGIEESETTMETATRTAADILALMCRPRYYLFVAEWGGTIFGWSSLSPDRDHPFYEGVGDVRVHISRSARSQGLGRLLVRAVVECAAEHGFHKLVGRIASTNESSRRLCRALGFREIGVHEKHGRVGSRWIDVVLVEKIVGEVGGATFADGLTAEAHNVDGATSQNRGPEPQMSADESGKDGP
jgi:phosphinothricin acetyltransferase